MWEGSFRYNRFRSISVHNVVLNLESFLPEFIVKADIWSYIGDSFIYFLLKKFLTFCGKVMAILALFA